MTGVSEDCVSQIMTKARYSTAEFDVALLMPLITDRRECHPAICASHVFCVFIFSFFFSNGMHIWN